MKTLLAHTLSRKKLQAGSFENGTDTPSPKLSTPVTGIAKKQPENSEFGIN